jgi:MFS family permease
MAVENGIVTAFAVLYLPLIQEFGASRADVAVVQSAVLLVGGLGGPLIGWAFDRLGPRRLFQLGAIIAAIAFVAASRLTSLLGLVLVYGLVGGLGLAALSSNANMIVAALWYPAARGRAIAVADVGTGAGAFAMVPLAQVLVTALGWRATLLVWAAVLLGLVVPLNALQRLPEAQRAMSVTSSSDDGWTPRNAMRSASFWWLAGQRFFGACAFPVMNVHMVAFAIGQGVAPAAAATALGAVSLVSLAGRLGTGWLSDQLGRPETLTITYTSAAIGIGCLAMLAWHGAPWWLLLYIVFYGLAQGSTGIVGSARAADVFAGPTFGAIYGWLVLAAGPGEALGAWLGGRLFDATTSYLPAFGLAVLALAGGVFSMWQITRRGTKPSSEVA